MSFKTSQNDHLNHQGVFTIFCCYFVVVVAVLENRI